MAKAQEKRKYKRLKAYHLVKYRLAFSPQDPLVLAYIRDIGAGGVCLATKERLPTDSILQVYVNFPWLSSPVPTLAKVVWVKAVGRKARFDLGLKFSEINDIIRKDIHERIENAR